MVPPDSHRISRARCYLGYNSGGNAFSCTGLSPSTATPSRGLPLTTLLSHSPPARQNRPSRPTTPTTQRLPAITCNRFSLIRFRSPLLTESRLFSLPVGTEMFHFPTFPPHALCVQARVTPHDWCGVPPFGNPRINARLTAPRGLSQPPTSFIGSWCPGIHRVPLTTWPHKNIPPTHARKDIDERAYKNSSYTQKSQKMLASTVQFSTNNQTPPTRPRRTHTPRRRDGGTRNRTALNRDNTHAPTRGRPVPSGPNSVPTTGRPRTDSVPRTPRRGGRTGSPQQRPAELVSVPPSSTTPHTRRHPVRAPITAWARLWTGQLNAGRPSAP